MSSFRTELPALSAPFSISHADSLLSIGSCFTENIGKRLSSLKFSHYTHPFGIVYNPISMAMQLEILLSGKLFSESDLFENQGLWHSWLHHSSFSGLEQSTTLEKINHTLQQAQTVLPQVKRLLITFGTANIFVLKESGKSVANCHKVPATAFEKRRLSVSEIVNSFLPVLQQLKAQNADLQIVFTLSPVRHIRDGLIENQKSKATLLLAIDEICNRLGFAYYFPAYELLLDDLRDYRFYEADMIHPNTVAIDYVWQRFGDTFFTGTTKQLIGQIEALLKATQHRVFHLQSDLYQFFAQKQLKKIAQLEQEYPFLDFSEEKQCFTRQSLLQ